MSIRGKAIIGGRNLKKLKAIDVSGTETIYKSYKIVPYPEIMQIMKNNGIAFVEGIDRRTAYSAKKILSKRLGFEVMAEKRLVVTKEEDDSIDAMEGYIFSKKEV